MVFSAVTTILLGDSASKCVLLQELVIIHEHARRAYVI